MGQQIRGQEVSIVVSVDGEILGAPAKVTEFELTPDDEVSKQDYLGEVRSDGDYMSNGADFSFSVNHEDSAILDLLLDLIQRDNDRTVHPSITITAFFQYRKSGAADKVMVLSDCFMKVDDVSVGGRKDFVTSSFSGFAKNVLSV